MYLSENVLTWNLVQSICQSISTKFNLIEILQHRLSNRFVCHRIKLFCKWYLSNRFANRLPLKLGYHCDLSNRFPNRFISIRFICEVYNRFVNRLPSKLGCYWLVQFSFLIQSVDCPIDYTNTNSCVSLHPCYEIDFPIDFLQSKLNFCWFLTEENRLI